MTKIKKSISIAAPVEKVFAYITTPTNFPEVWPSMVEVSNVKESPQGGHNFDWVYKMAGIHFEGHSDTVEFEENRRVATRSEKGIQNTFQWTFEGKDGTTEVHLEVDYALPSKVLSKLAEPFLRRLNEREAQTLLDNLKERMELEQEEAA